MPTNEKRYFWLKLSKDFFQGHKIRILENMPKGKEYCLFYLKILLESVAHEGSLRLNETIAYDEATLAGVTNTDVDTVRVALNVFQQLQLIEIWGDKTIFIVDSPKMIGSETDAAERMRRIRDERTKSEHQRTLFKNVTPVFFPPTTPFIESRDENTESRDKSLKSLKEDKPKIDLDRPTVSSGSDMVDGLIQRLFKEGFLEHPLDLPEVYRYEKLISDLLSSYQVANVNQSLKYCLMFSRSHAIDDKYAWLYTAMNENCEKFKNGPLPPYDPFDNLDQLLANARAAGWIDPYDGHRS